MVNEATRIYYGRANLGIFFFSICTRTLSQNGLFNIFEMALSDTEPKIKMAGAEILLSAMEHDPNLVRSYIVKQSEDKDQRQLMDVLLDQMLVEEDVGIKLQYSEVLRVLLDTNPNQMDNGMQIVNNTAPHDPDLDKFLDLFYQRFVEKLVSPMLELSEGTLLFLQSIDQSKQGPTGIELTFFDFLFYRCHFVRSQNVVALREYLSNLDVHGPESFFQEQILCPFKRDCRQNVSPFQEP